MPCCDAGEDIWKLRLFNEKSYYYKLFGGPLFGGPLLSTYDSVYVPSIRVPWRLQAQTSSAQGPKGLGHKGVRSPVSKSIHG